MADFPPLPRKVSGIIGPIAVSVVVEVDQSEESATVHDARTFGEWFPVERRIRIRKSLAPILQWHTLYHEQCHAWLDDTGARYGIPEDLEERICEAVALGRLREMQEKMRQG